MLLLLNFLNSLGTIMNSLSLVAREIPEEIVKVYWVFTYSGVSVPLTVTVPALVQRELFCLSGESPARSLYSNGTPSVSIVFTVALGV
ncbi:unnamed protein product [Blepharisma stoltei]|uniref:Uncharacterized protein n=1 Tax=Blepharisma stoltei TaxID=1481888 RepID=A0AAU9IZF5_9CILI|nr:unnamed protein product [Blepharisma stoltei]